MDTGKSRPSIRDLMRPDLRHLAGYTPVVPVERLVSETSASSGVALTPVKLDANENPYGPSPRVLQAISESEALHTYPDAEQRTLRAALAEYAGLAYREHNRRQRLRRSPRYDYPSPTGTR